MPEKGLSLVPKREAKRWTVLPVVSAKAYVRSIWRSSIIWKTSRHTLTGKKRACKNSGTVSIRQKDRQPRLPNSLPWGPYELCDTDRAFARSFCEIPMWSDSDPEGIRPGCDFHLNSGLQCFLVTESDWIIALHRQKMMIQSTFRSSIDNSWSGW